jgi:tRNA threonylcarbamoyladenosine biosynthesis protein TsaB
MRILAVDTATEACSAALAWEGDLIERYDVIGRGHAERLLPMVQDVLAEGGVALSALDAIAFGRGPGSFTGLRIGAGVTQGLAFGANLPVVPVSDLAALAARAATQRNERYVLACLDARMAQVYWAAFDCADVNAPVALTPEAVSDAGDVRLPDGTGDIPIFLSGGRGDIPPFPNPSRPGLPAMKPKGKKECPLFFGVGHGLSAYPALHTLLGPGLTGFDAELLPHAREIALIGAEVFARGGAVGAEQAQPVYIRDDVAHKR